jgi:hypothetical protein
MVIIAIIKLYKNNYFILYFILLQDYSYQSKSRIVKRSIVMDSPIITIGYIN